MFSKSSRTQDTEGEDEYQRFRAFFEDAPLYCYMVSPKGIILDVNKAALHALGYTRVELIGKHIRTIYASECEEKVRDIFQAWKPNGAIINEELVVVDKEGNKRTVLLNASAVKDAAGNLVQSISIQQDITELKKIEEALKESRAAFEQAVEEKTIVLNAISEHVIYQDLDNRIIWANKAAAESINKTIEDIAGEFCYTLWGERETPCEGCPVVKAQKTGIIHESEMTTPDGRVWTVRGYPVKNSEGEITGCVEVTYDITIQKRAEEAYHQLVDQSLQGLFIIQQGKVIFTNPAFRELSGYSEEEILNWNPWQVFEFIHPEDQARPWEQLQAAIAGDDRPMSSEIRGIRRDGSMRWFELSLSVIEYQGQLATQATIMDIHERKITEDIIRRERDKAQQYLDIAGVLFIAGDVEGTITLVNKKALEVFGYTEEEMIGQNYFDLCIPESIRYSMKRRYEGIIKGEIEYSPFVENPIITKDGAERLISWHTTPLNDDEGKMTGFLTAGNDITERKVAEDALLIERDRAQRYLELAGVMFLGVNANEEIFLINRKGSEILGYSENELIGKNFFDMCLQEDDRKVARKFFKEALAGKAELLEHSERAVLAKNGSVRMISWHTVTLRDDAGNMTGLLSSGEDITERAFVEAAVKASEEKFRSLVENTADWVWEVDNEGRFTYSNSSVEDIMGITAGQVIGRTMWEYMKPEEIEQNKIFFKENISKKRGFKNIVNQFLHRDGNLLILEANGRPILNQENQVIGFRGVFRDITQRMRADDVLRESEARYRALVETSPDAITVIDIDGNILLVNNRTAHLLGFKEQKELLGRNCFDFIIPEQRTEAIEALQGTVERGTANPLPFTMINKDNQTFPAEISASLLIDGMGKPAGYILVTRNITQRKAAEHELQEAKARAEFFTDLMAHDLNNINQAILSALEITLLNHDIPSDLQSQIRVALDQVERSSELIGRVKKFSQIGYAKALLEVRDVEPDFRSAFKAGKQAFPAKSVRVDTNIHPGEFQVLADDLLIDLFFNLVHNAVKFNRSEKVVLEVKAFNDTNRRFLRIEIIDQGPGIPDALKKLIFARYTHRVDERTQGSGIGLTLVHQIITRYGGKIWVEDRVKGDYTKGAKFVILLPIWS